MIRYIQNDSVDPRFNLALEQYVFDSADRSFGYFMLWQNKDTVVVGKHQNTIAEICAPFIKDQNISVVRRLSGGGAVYHDLGNVNFTFITDCQNSRLFDFSEFCKPILRTLKDIGVHAILSGRNDITIDGKKFSGNAQYMKQDRIMHHGTLMFDSDLSVLEKALAVSKDKIESKGLVSVRSRVTNIKPYVSDSDMDVTRFIGILKQAVAEQFDMKEYRLSRRDYKAIRQIKDDIYDRWEWNYGASPDYSIRKERRVEGCGKIEVSMNVEKGNITGIAFHGDYFGNGDSKDLVDLLLGVPLEAQSLKAALSGCPISNYFHRLDLAAFLGILLQ